MANTVQPAEGRSRILAEVAGAKSKKIANGVSILGLAVRRMDTERLETRGG
jgi:hypothetical protein